MTTQRQVLCDQVDNLIDRQLQWAQVLDVALDDAVLTDDERYAFVCFALGHSTAFIGVGLDRTREGARLITRRAIAKVMGRIQGRKVQERSIQLGDFGARNQQQDARVLSLRSSR